MSSLLPWDLGFFLHKVIMSTSWILTEIINLVGANSLRFYYHAITFSRSLLTDSWKADALGLGEKEVARAPSPESGASHEHR